MKSFNINAKSLIVRFECPVCKAMIEADVTGIIPTPIMVAEHVEESERSGSMIVICEVCGAEFKVEVFMNMNEGNVAVYDADGKEIEDIELTVEL